MESQTFSYRIIRSKRKTMAIQIADGRVIVRCPMWMTDEKIRAFVSEKAGWIQKHLAKFRACESQSAITEEELTAMWIIIG